MLSKEVVIIALALFSIPAECINIISRSDWGAKPPTNPHTPLRTSPIYVVIHHSTGSSCTSKNSCVARLKNIQTDHIKNRGFNDIGYNFLVGEDGNIYEGRGWGKLGSHAKGYNSKSIGICVLGSYTDSPPNAKALKAVQDLIDYAASNSKIDQNYKIVGHRQTKATSCPGTALYNVIQTWPHWSDSFSDGIARIDGFLRTNKTVTIRDAPCDLVSRQGEHVVFCGPLSELGQEAEGITPATTSTYLIGTGFVDTTSGFRDIVAMDCNYIAVWILCYLCSTTALRIISRDKWGARPPTEPPQRLEVDPVSHVVIHHSATERCTNTPKCLQSVKYFQDLHIDVNNWDDIGYNFVVGEDGNIYEGRGWGKRGAHAPPYNSKSVGICIVGTFIDLLPNEKALRAVKNLIAFGVQSKKIMPSYRLMGHRQAVSTECPGEALFNEIKTWPHWTSTPEE